VTGPRVYEQERLQLAVQEAIAEALSRGKVSKSAVARATGKGRPNVTRMLRSGRNLTLRSVADVLWAAGYRMDVKLMRVP
jgi:DNA-binding phage protein